MREVKVGRALPQKSFASALPSDVRRGFASPLDVKSNEAMPLVRALLQQFWAKGRTAHQTAEPYEEYFRGKAGREMEMNLESMIALAASALLLIYLTYALLRPEKF